MTDVEAQEFGWNRFAQIDWRNIDRHIHYSFDQHQSNDALLCAAPVLFSGWSLKAFERSDQSLG